MNHTSRMSFIIPASRIAFCTCLTTNYVCASTRSMRGTSARKQLDLQIGRRMQRSMTTLLSSKGTNDDKSKATASVETRTTKTKRISKRVPVIPDQTEELIYASEGYDVVIGVDESGRGCLAGPVVAAAAYLPLGIGEIPGLMDSKKVATVEKREKVYETLRSIPGFHAEVCVVDNMEIDRINILQATLNGMAMACSRLIEREAYMNDNKKCIALVDGNMVPRQLAIPGRAIIKGDTRVLCISAASIVAKVIRDRLMLELDAKYPEYSLKEHKGYSTKKHQDAIRKHGPSPIHRMSYGPVANWNNEAYWQGTRVGLNARDVDP